MSRIVKVLAMGAVAGIAYRAGKAQAVPARIYPGAPGCPPVRDAGHEAQKGISEADWDLVDEQSDESFPASDPPANY